MTTPTTFKERTHLSYHGAYPRWSHEPRLSQGLSSYPCTSCTSMSTYSKSESLSANLITCKKLESFSLLKLTMNKRNVYVIFTCHGEYGEPFCEHCHLQMAQWRTHQLSKPHTVASYEEPRRKLKIHQTTQTLGRRFPRQRNTNNKKNNSTFDRERTSNQNHSMEDGGSTEPRHNAMVTRRTTAAMEDEPKQPWSSVNCGTTIL